MSSSPTASIVVIDNGPQAMNLVAILNAQGFEAAVVANTENVYAVATEKKADLIVAFYAGPVLVSGCMVSREISAKVSRGEIETLTATCTPYGANDKILVICKPLQRTAIVHAIKKSITPVSA